jgi:membrane associated rhomboid family serine protease
MNPMLQQYLMVYGASGRSGREILRPWQLVSYMFIHASMGHIFFNLFALWIFGQGIENFWGTKRFATYYFLTGIGAASDPYVDRRYRCTDRGGFRRSVRYSC